MKVQGKESEGGSRQAFQLSPALIPSVAAMTFLHVVRAPTTPKVTVLVVGLHHVMAFSMYS